MDNSLIAIRITEMAKIKNLTIEDLAEKVGVTKQALYRMFERGDMKLSVLLGVAKVLETPASYFYEELDGTIVLTELENRQRVINELKLLTKQVEILSDQAIIVKKMFGIEP